MFHVNVDLTVGMAPATTGPLRDGSDVSWISKCRAGDDQGNTAACTTFAFASWAEVMSGNRISDAEVIESWRKARLSHGRDLKGGLSIPEAWYAARKAGWLTSEQSIKRVRNLSSLDMSPLVACYQLTKGWDHPNAAGCIDHHQKAITGYHAVLLVAHGCVGGVEPMVWIENSWGSNWGYKGFGCMTEDYHRIHCKELWAITV